MCDLISRQAALNELPHALWGKEWDEALAKAIIESMPTIDHVKHGRWVEHLEDWHKCSVCGEVAPSDDMVYEYLTPFCPYCGASMDQEDEDEE